MEGSSTVLTLTVGAAGLIAVSGVGRLLIRPLRPLALHWYAALAMLAGFAVCSVAIQILALVGSVPASFRSLGAAMLAIGVAGHWLGRGRYRPLPLPNNDSSRGFALGLLGFIALLLLIVSLAPSSKADEIFYHMLIGRRVLQDQGLRIYQLPAEAILPQMGYQIAETVFDAVHAADAGNVLSLGFGLVLWLMIYGVVADETGRPDVGLIAALAAAVGLYPAVWYVTCGPHPFGDLATFTAVAALIFPSGLSNPGTNGVRDWDGTRSFACTLGAACAASTKISLFPVAAAITLFAILLAGAPMRARMIAMAAAWWIFLIGPLIIWTYLETGAPLGAAFAEFVGRTRYQPFVMEALAASRRINQRGLRYALWYAFTLLNGAGLALIAGGAVACCLRWRRVGPLLFLFVMQLMLIAILLPHDFRFLGGLEFGLLAAGAIGLAALRSAQFHFKWFAAAAIVLLGPWFAAELYYVRPFAAVTLGVTSRDDFLDRYVALAKDFRALDQLLPPDAVLYVVGGRVPSIYAPRPIVFTPVDWNGRAPLFRLTARLPDQPGPIASEAGLSCDAAIYRNPDAIVVAYRTPNHQPDRGMVIVQRCERAPGGAGAPH